MSTEYPDNHQPHDEPHNSVATSEEQLKSDSADFSEDNGYDESPNSSVETIVPADFDTVEADNENTQAEPEPEFTGIDIQVLNKVYTINCPIGEEDELFEANDFINSFIADLQSQAPQLPHENLLVLCCLNLYEKLQQSNSLVAQKEQDIEQASQLIEQMIKDMQLTQ